MEDEDSDSDGEEDKDSLFGGVDDSLESIEFFGR